MDENGHFYGCMIVYVKLCNIMIKYVVVWGTNVIGSVALPV